MIVQYYSNKPTLTAIEEDIDTCMDNLISRVRASARLNSDEIAFIIYDICGFDYKSIALLLNISANSSATRKSRIKLKLPDLASESGLSGLDNIPLTL
ncbi:MAG: sigma-70 region 4 domain-containing protein [Muribaculaceae bacterium]|nr:sigma-70 region 4 domain-containing protein [Muribaculaceae bacterium]